MLEVGKGGKTIDKFPHFFYFGVENVRSVLMHCDAGIVFIIIDLSANVFFLFNHQNFEPSFCQESGRGCPA